MTPINCKEGNLALYVCGDHSFVDQAVHDPNFCKQPFKLTVTETSTTGEDWPVPEEPISGYHVIQTCDSQATSTTFSFAAGTLIDRDADSGTVCGKYWGKHVTLKQGGKGLFISFEGTSYNHRFRVSRTEAHCRAFTSDPSATEDAILVTLRHEGTVPAYVKATIQALGEAQAEAEAAASGWEMVEEESPQGWLDGCQLM